MVNILNSSIPLPSLNSLSLNRDEADYGGIGVLRLPPDKVWKPDIVLFNNADGNYEVRYKSNVLIYPNGEVLWVPPAIYQVNIHLHINSISTILIHSSIFTELMYN